MKLLDSGMLTNDKNQGRSGKRLLDSFYAIICVGRGPTDSDLGGKRSGHSSRVCSSFLICEFPQPMRENSLTSASKYACNAHRAATGPHAPLQLRRFEGPINFRNSTRFACGRRKWATQRALCSSLLHSGRFRQHVLFVNFGLTAA